MSRVNRQMELENRLAAARETARTGGRTAPDYGDVHLILTEEEKRRKALEVHRQLFGGTVPREKTEGAGGDPAPEAVKIPKTNPNRRENEFMMNLMILRNSLATNAPACRERARAAGKWVWRDIRLLITLVNKVQEKLLRTMPESRDDYYLAYAKHGHYELRMDGPVRTGRQILITDRNLGSICEAAMTNECLMCMREGSEIGKCGLREALLEVAPPTEIRDGLWRQCEYRGAAGDLIHGRDVSI